MSRPFRLGVDIGGTFTDLILLDDDLRKCTVVKTLTPADEPARAVESALDGVGFTADSKSIGGAEGSRVARFVHGTTLVTNAIIERKGAPTALLATQGHRDVLEIRREHRYDLYDLALDHPEPLVPRYLRFEVAERTLSDGSIRQPLDLAPTEALIGELDRKGIRALAVSLLHSYRNPTHEQQIAEVARRVAPEMRVSLSHEVVAELREFERTSTTVANVYVQELAERYLHELEAMLEQRGFAGRLFVMLSSGGLAAPDTAARFPIRLVESGPAAGALAAAAFGTQLGNPDLLSFDMGGTTAKLCVIAKGRPTVTHDFEVDRVYRFKKGSGLPIRVPVIDMVEIGAGGGSIARIDFLGLLRVGPESAGASPGPACYGLGGDLPTVTDADLVLGYLDAGYFLGGEMRLYPDRARQAVERLAHKAGLSLEETAWAVHRVVNENMAEAAKVHLAERGQDPRGVPLLAFGGAGPVHAFGVARALGTRMVLVPPRAGVTSSVGLLVAPLAFDFVRSGPGLLAHLDWELVNRLLGQMRREAAQLLEGAGLRGDAVSYEYAAEMRYQGQGYQVHVPIPPPPLGPGQVKGLEASFDNVYRSLFGRSGPRVPLEVVNWRLTASGPGPELDPGLLAERGPTQLTAHKGERPAYFPELGGYTPTSVLDRYALSPGDQFVGPAVVEERESTVVVGPGAAARVDPHGVLVVTLDRRGTPQARGVRLQAGA